MTEETERKSNKGQKRPRRYKVERAKVVKPAERRSYTEFMQDEFNQYGFVKPTAGLNALMYQDHVRL